MTTRANELRLRRALIEAIRRIRESKPHLGVLVRQATRGASP